MKSKRKGAVGGCHTIIVRRKWIILTVILAFTALAGQANADPLVLFNTGVVTQGTLAADGSVDTHYTIFAGPAGAGAAFVLPNHFLWLANGPDSKWIGPQGGNDGGPVGNYTYRTTFTIPVGFDPSTAMITGQWSSDNNGTDIIINGISTGHTTPLTAFTSFHSFSISSGFVAGLNTLDFTLFNEAGPTGLRVELSGSVQPFQGEPVPEPASPLLPVLASLVLHFFENAKPEVSSPRLKRPSLLCERRLP